MPSTSNETTVTTDDVAKHVTNNNNDNDSNNTPENCGPSTKHDNNNNDNPIRTTIIRYCGYANEIGESFRYQYPKYVIPSYVIAFSYCLCDTLYCGYQSYNNNNNNNNNYDDENNNNKSHHNTDNTTSASTTTPIPAQTLTKSATVTAKTTNTSTNRTLLVLYTMVDTMIWQTLASVLLPGIAINTIVKCTRYMVGTATATAISDSSTTKLINSTNKNQLQLVRVRHWIPTMVGLISIPVIIHPIDTAVDTLLDNTTRQIYSMNNKD